MSLRNIAEYIGKIVQRHPYSWKLSWELVHRLTFLLPHDASYAALRHFALVHPQGLFLDVGANDGISALSFRRFSNTSPILSIEPNPALEPALAKIKSSDSRFDYRIVGAGAQHSHVQFFVPRYSDITLHTFTSTNRGGAMKVIEDVFGRRVASHVQIQAFNSEIIPLDELGVSPAIIKIDTEGFDYAVLQGLRETIERTRPFVMIEVSPEQRSNIASYFGDRNYKLARYDTSADAFNEFAAPSFPDDRNIFAIPAEKTGVIPFHST